MSSRKYNQAVSELARLRLDSGMQASKLADLEYRKSSEILKMERTIREQNDELERLEKKLQSRETKSEEISSAMHDIFPSLSDDAFDTYVEDGLMHIEIGHNILFNRGEDALSDHGLRVIRELSGSLQDIQSEIMILGHADSTKASSPQTDKWKVSFDRAQTVMEVMVKNGVPEEKLIVAGKGKYNPEASNRFPIGQLLNRRIELIVMPDLDEYAAYLQEVPE